MRTLSTLLLAAAFTSAAHAGILFNDNFDSYTPGAQASLSPNWTIVTGNLDVVASGTNGITCFNNTGNCLDMDGGTGATIRTTQTFDLIAGHQYRVQILHSGNQRSGSDTAFASSFVTTQNQTVFGGGGSGQPPFDTPFFLGTSIFLVSQSVPNATFQIRTSGNDGIGVIIDGVTITDLTAPEPASLLLSATALAALAFLRRRLA